MQDRNATITVLKKTGIPYDPNQHRGQATEIITQGTFKKRQTRIVLKKTGILYDPDQHRGQATEVITQTTFESRRAVVLKGTGIAYKRDLHKGQATETVTRYFANKRKRMQLEATISDAAATADHSLTSDSASSNADFVSRSVSSLTPSDPSSASVPGSSGHSLNSFHLFAAPVVKREVIEIHLEKIINAIRAAIKMKRKGNNADQNCGFLTEYSILALVNLFQGKEIPTQEISTEASLDSTCSAVGRRFLPIKNEEGEPVRKQLRTTYSAAYPSDIGLHAHLPPKEITRVDLTEDKMQEQNIYELDATAIPRMPIKVNLLNQHLIAMAAAKNRVLIGHIVLARLGRNKVDHALSFCATANDIFFVDGQCFDGINNTGDPVMKNLHQYFSFTTQIATSETGEFADDCFYLIHHELSVKLSACSVRLPSNIVAAQETLPSYRNLP